MELWVRSQDKERLLKIISIFVEYNGDVNPNIHTHSIIGNNCVNLGIYNTKERALEVLDEIQNKICPIDLINIGYGTILYEMPKE